MYRKYLNTIYNNIYTYCNMFIESKTANKLSEKISTEDNWLWADCWEWFVGSSRHAVIVILAQNRLNDLVKLFVRDPGWHITCFQLTWKRKVTMSWSQSSYMCMGHCQPQKLVILEMEWMNNTNMPMVFVKHFPCPIPWDHLENSIGEFTVYHL